MAALKSVTPPSKAAFQGITFSIAAVLILWFLFRFLLGRDQNDPAFRISAGLLLIIVATAVTIIFFLIVTSVFGVTNFKKGFLNFLIGENGTYSLSRLQAVAWAVVIMSFQIQLFICFFINPNGRLLSIYQPVLSETATWLLGLSLTSYIAVKGITVNQMANNPELMNRQKVTPQWSDILVGTNGLDFSKCQMLVWTIIAIAVFEIKCYYFNKAVLWEHRDMVLKLINHFYDEYNSKDQLTDRYPWAPFLPWTFVVLMGMSQGVYVGKKLVPTFKLDDMKANKQQELQDQTQQLEAKKANLMNILDNTTQSASLIDAASVAAIKKDILSTEDRINELNGDINQITSLLH